MLFRSLSDSSVGLPDERQIEILQEIIREAQRSIARLRSTSRTSASPPPITPTRTHTLDIPPLHLSRLSTEPAPSELSPASRPPLPSSQCPRTHVRRRAIDDECVICRDGEPMTALPLSELVWCKSECGRSVHKRCFRDWQDDCRAIGRSLSCTLCRADWAADCACDTATPETAQ